MKIVVLAGGLSPERNVSLSTGCMVAEALRGRGHRVALVDMFFGVAEGGDLEALFDRDIPEEFKHVSRETPDLERVRALAPDGVDLVVDYVGGVLEQTLAVLAPGGRHGSIADGDRKSVV